MQYLIIKMIYIVWIKTYKTITAMVISTSFRAQTKE